MLRRFATVLATVMTLALAAGSGCTEAPGSRARIPMAQAALPIVGGTAETGWPAVGAMTATFPGYGYYGSYCSGTLIAPQWVLTAAHCIVSTEDLPLDNATVQFYIGANANDASTGRLVTVDYRVAHPDYDPADPEVNHDIGLAHLATPVADVTPLPIQTTTFQESWVGTDAFYVGFGINNPSQGTGGGVKRSAYIPIEGLASTVYYSQYDGQGVCFGDSGGPGLYQASGTWRVIGVNSAVDSDDCNGYGIHTRVDWYAPWVAQTMGAELPDCNEVADMCACPEACGAGGLCDNAVCATATCAEAYDCMVNCGEDQACLTGCYYDAGPEGRAQLDALFQCLDTNCGSASDYQACAESKCATQIDACFAIGTGELTCAEVYDCFYGCAQDDNACVNACYGQGSSEAQSQVMGLSQCLNQYCASQTTNDGFMDCLAANCIDPYYACFPPADCDLVGGDCAAGTACYPTGSGRTDCYPSDEARLGAPCDPTLADRLACDDGLICLGEGSAGVCEQFCFDDAPCGEGRACEIPVFESLQDIGVCQDVVCTDVDLDTYCDDVDCNDGDAAVNPGASEVCGNGADDDCNGQTDDGCACTDDDDDGFCAGVDCNDGNPAVNPDADENCTNTIDDDCDGKADAQDDDCAGCVDQDQDGQCADVDCDDGDAAVFKDGVERCRNQRDDDCDGLTDEGCEDCLDVDQDGFCADVDCDDGSATVHPLGDEICGNDRDDDCDGARDEDCVPCVDDDRDGVCVELDCNDGDAAVRPGIDETCGNGLDDNCNGRIDEGCGTCTDVDRDGVCDFLDCDDGNAAVFPGADEACGNGVDDNCNGRTDEGCDGGGGCAAGGGPSDTAVPLLIVAFGLVLSRRRLARGAR